MFWFLLLFPAMSAYAEPICESGWSTYKDELCIRIFPSDVITYDDAKVVCAEYETASSKASLVMVKNQAIQEFLANLTQEMYNSVWLGGRYDNTAGDFKWEDGNSLLYTNWQKGYPRLVDKSNSCVELRPPNSKSLSSNEGNWADVTCRKRNLVACQKDMAWSLEDAINEIKRFRVHFKNELEQVTSYFEEELEAVKSRVVPIGSIYIEYYNQPSPRTLWPSLTWHDISNSYAGMFFRVSGGQSAGWGATQEECSPRITHMRYAHGTHGYPTNAAVPTSGWSPNCKSGGDWWTYKAGDEGYDEQALSLHTQNCEVRPRNQATRIWKRTA